MPPVVMRLHVTPLHATPRRVIPLHVTRLHAMLRHSLELIFFIGEGRSHGISPRYLTSLRPRTAARDHSRGTDEKPDLGSSYLPCLSP